MAIACTSCLLAAVFLCGLVSTSSARAREPRQRAVFLWVRRAGDDEMRLSPPAVPALRALARSGTAVRELERFEPADLLARLRELRPQVSGGYRELAGSSEAAESAVLAELESRFGAPPPVSQDELSALERMRRASGDAPPAELEVELEATPPPGNGASETAATLAESLADAFAEGARLAVRVDAAPADPCTDPDGRRSTDRELGEVLDAFRGEPGGEAGQAGTEILVAVLLIPDSGRPALVLSGRGVRSARVVSAPARTGAASVTSGIARLLGARPSAGAEGEWLARALETAGLSSRSKTPEKDGGGR